MLPHELPVIGQWQGEDGCNQGEEQRVQRHHQDPTATDPLRQAPKPGGHSGEQEQRGDEQAQRRGCRPQDGAASVVPDSEEAWLGHGDRLGRVRLCHGICLEYFQQH